MIAEIQDFNSTELKKKTVVRENSYEHTILLVAVRFWFWLKEISRLEFQVNRAANKDFGSS
jgi:hypothetical protein